MTSHGPVRVLEACPERCGQLVSSIVPAGATPERAQEIAAAAMRARRQDCGWVPRRCPRCGPLGKTWFAWCRSCGEPARPTVEAFLKAFPDGFRLADRRSAS